MFKTSITTGKTKTSTKKTDFSKQKNNGLQVIMQSVLFIVKKLYRAPS